jgi:PBP1b-binding outer membrane lipoprotein LpoB
MSKSIKIVLSIAASAMIYSSCVVGPQYATPKQNLPKDFGAGVQSDSTSLVKWFDLFGDTTLQNIIKTTLQNNINFNNTGEKQYGLVNKIYSKNGDIEFVVENESYKKRLLY